MIISRLEKSQLGLKYRLQNKTIDSKTFSLLKLL